MPASCHRALSGIDLILFDKIFRSDDRPILGGRRNCRSGNFCRAVYPLLTIIAEFGRRSSVVHGGANIAGALCDWIGNTGTTPMRIYGPNGTTLGQPASGPRRSGRSAFTLPDTSATADNRPVAAPKPSANIDALLAMQSIEDPLERRKRSVKRGRGALDVLDELKLGLLTGSLDQATVARLRAAAADLKASSGDPGLDSVLAEIELRVEVELAKAGQF
jgi:hypothetical protein